MKRREFITLLGGALPRETTSPVKSRCPNGITGGAQKTPELLLGPFANAIDLRQSIGTEGGNIIIFGSRMLVSVQK